MAVITKYASTVEEIKDDRFQSNSWSNLVDAVGSNGLVASSSYTIKDGKRFSPAQLYAHNFGIELPEQYNIKSVDIDVRIRGSAANTLVPRGYIFYQGGIGHVGMTYSSNVYTVQPETYLADGFGVVNYHMNYSDIVQYKLTKNRLESDVFGLILQFNESSQDKVAGVSVDWIRVTIEYEEPTYKIEIQGRLTDRKYEAPYHFKYGVSDPVDVTIKVHNTGSITSNPKAVNINIPLGLHLYYYETSQGAYYNPNTDELELDWSYGRSPYLKLYLHARYVGTKEINVTGDSQIGSLSKYLYVEKTWHLGADEDVAISSGEVRRWSESEFHFAVRTINEDATASFNVFFDKDTDKQVLVEWLLDESLSSDGVSIADYTKSFIEFNIPPDEEVEIHFTGRFLLKFEGERTLTVVSEDTLYRYTYEYTCLEPYRYVADFVNRDIVFSNARLVSQVETGAYVYPIAVSEYDSTLVEDKCTLRLTRFDDIDYIGCVALKQTHFNPKSTYKDTLLNTTYKNKTYMGKKGAIDETITLNVRLPPKDVTTMQGLVAMDKPIPINANHLAFEGDSLNHRGWAELYGITSEETNPHWYKCVLSVKYLTHNLNTRFLINKGSRVSDYFLPELMTAYHSYGEDITKRYYIETNGGYYYNKDELDYHKRTMLALPYGKRFEIKGMDKLSIKSEINFNWYSTRNYENTENNMSRIVRLIDSETGNSVLEYEWYDVDFSSANAYNCRAICRVLYKGAFKTVLNRNLILNNDIEYDSSEYGGMDVYGTELTFKIIADKLSIQDAGFSGKELVIEDIDLQNGQYYFDVEFTNNNITNDSPDIVNWVDINVLELKYTSEYSNYYKNLLVSPFCVPGKNVVFTRNSEEGTIFYLEDDGTECSYMVNPYYQYHCGVDLQSQDRISIFNLDNNYKTVFITNGLIKLGINRYTGRLDLEKYDSKFKRYIHTNTFQLTKYEDININSFTDDKLEIQVSDTIITIWRGRPFIRIAHETEDILFKDTFTKIYADAVGNSSSTLPKFFNLVDTTNLLPNGIGSDRLINEECWDVTESTIPDWSYDVYVDVAVNGGLANPTTITADYNYYTNEKMNFIIDGQVIAGIKKSGTGYTHTIDYQFKEEGEHTVRAVYYKGANYYLSEVITVNIVDNAYHIEATFPSTMYYLQNDFTCKLTYAKEPVANKTVIFYVNGLSYPKLTNEEGIARLNNQLSPREEEENKSQPDDYTTSNTPYNVIMTYASGGKTLATAMKEATILKGYVNIGLDKTTVVKGNPVTVQLKNNLDPDDDDIVEGEQYVKNTPVVLSVNGRDYPRVTDNEGKCKLMINLNPGNYDLRVTFTGNNKYQGTIRNFELVVNNG